MQLVEVLRTEGLEACLVALKNQLREASITDVVSARLQDALRRDDLFLQTFPDELVARLYDAALDDADLTRLVVAWFDEAHAPRLRALKRRPHGENPACLSRPLHLSPNEEFLLISGSRTELWSLLEDKRLWSRENYLASNLLFTTDSRFIVGEDIDYGGMTDLNPYTVILDVRSGEEVFYQDNYRTTGVKPEPFETAAAGNASAIKCSYEEASGRRRYWTIFDGERILARLPGRIAQCISAPRRGWFIAIEDEWFTLYTRA